MRTVGLAGLRRLRVDGLGKGYDLPLSPLLSGSPRSRANVLTAKLPISSSLTSCKVSSIMSAQGSVRQIRGRSQMSCASATQGGEGKASGVPAPHYWPSR